MDVFREQDQERAPSAARPVNCGGAIRAIWSLATQRYVSTEIFRGGILRARSPVKEDWEAFEFCREVSTGYTVIKSVENRHFVAVEIGGIDNKGSYINTLRARTPENRIGPWERFVLMRLGGNAYAIRSVANRHYVAAEKDWTRDDWGMLRARTSTGIGPWEQFLIVPF